MNLLLFGPPASGKGTQADLVSERLRIPQVATGNILRAEVAHGTALGVEAGGFMARGDLVPDRLMIEIIRVRLREPDCARGFILDGFPRTLAQADALDRLVADMGLRFDRLVLLDVPEDELVRRISGRLTCPICGRSYFFPHAAPHPEDCLADGGLLFTRPDDHPETARRRIAVYLENTLPVLDHYRAKGLVSSVDGIATVAEVTERILQVLGRTGTETPLAAC